MSATIRLWPKILGRRVHTGKRKVKRGEVRKNAKNCELIYLSGIRAAALSPGDPSQVHICLVCLSAHQICLQTPLHNLYA